LYQVKKRNQPKTPAYHTLHSLSTRSAAPTPNQTCALSLSLSWLSLFLTTRIGFYYYY